MDSNKIHEPSLERRSRRPNNGLQAGIMTYMESSSCEILDLKMLPKKYVLYPPLLILPVNFSSTTPEWKVRYGGLNAKERQDLFATIVKAFQPHPITHIAINAPITLENTADGSTNLMRSPGEITPVYGNLGPSSLLHPKDNEGQPTQADFNAALWISTVQNGGICQTWAPQWTMFSRGNITEKARILGDGNGMRGLTMEELDEDLNLVDVADFYIGIGYFALSYLKRGAKIVFGWEINGWSVEGLRRGCEQNGWTCVIVKVDGKGMVGNDDLNNILGLLRHCTRVGTCIVFMGNNRSAPNLLELIQTTAKQKGVSSLNLRHINLGLLPTARDSWQNAVRVLHPEKRGWVHVHENIDVQEIESKGIEIAEKFDDLVKETREGSWQASCGHVEQVKSYAPGVIHCVFDIEIKPS